MMPLLAIFILIGIVLIAIEGFTPHGVCGALGCAIIAVSCLLNIRSAGVVTGTLFSVFAVSGSIGVIFTLIQLFVLKGDRKVRHSNPVGSPEAGEASPALLDLGVVVKPLRPTGEIEWRGRRLPARSLDLGREVGVGRVVRIRAKDSSYYVVDAVEN